MDGEELRRREAWIEFWDRVTKFFVLRLSEIEALQAETVAAVRGREGDIGNLLTRWPTKYVHLYRLSYRRQYWLSIAVFMLLFPGELVTLTRAGLLRRFNSLLSGEPDAPLPERPDWQVLLAVAAFAPLTANLRAITNYGEPINVLLRKAEAGDRLALRRAIAADPAVLLLPPANKHLAFQGYVRDGEGLQWLTGSLAAARDLKFAGKEYDVIRLILEMMRATNSDRYLDRESAFELFAERNRIFSAHGRSEEPPTLLWRNCQRWLREQPKISTWVFPWITIR